MPLRLSRERSAVLPTLATSLATLIKAYITTIKPYDININFYNTKDRDWP